MKQDRFLIGILVSIGVLVVVALGLFFLRRGQQNYGPEIAPKDIVRNYVIALQKEDYEQAYNYLLEAEGQPSFDNFWQEFPARGLGETNLAVQVGETRQSGTEAEVNLTLLHGENEPFGNLWREATWATLIIDDEGNWKIVDMPYPYWGYNWYPTLDNILNPEPAP